MSDDGAQSLSDLRDIAAQWYANRFRSFFSRATNQGLGSFFIFAVLLTTSLVLARVVWFKSKQDDAYLDQLMRTEMQPMSVVTKAAVLSVVLQGLGESEVAHELFCGEESQGECGWIEKLRQDLEERISAVPDPTSQSAVQASEGQPADVNPQSAGRGELTRLKPCDWADAQAKLKVEQRLKQFNLSNALCSSGANLRTIQVVPEQVADALNGPLGRTPRLERVQSDGKQFEAAIGKFAATLPTSESKAGPRLVAAYFISVDSVIQYWSRDSRVSAEEFPTYRHWAALPYFEDLLKKLPAGHQTETKAYLDFVGKGIVYSRCQEVRPDNSGGISVGALCVDYALSETGIQKLVEAINRSPISKAGLVEYVSKGGGTLSALDVAGPLSPLDSGFKEWLDEMPEKWAKNPDMRRDITPYPDAKVLTYFIPLGMRADGRPRGVALTIDGVGPLGSSPLLILVTVLALMGAIYAYRIGAGSSKKIAHADQLLGRLRSLQVGVLQTDGSDRITDGNDRAEELVGIPLPPFGLQDKPKSLWELFDVKSIVGIREGVLTPNRVLNLSRAELVKRTRDDIVEEREAGISSTYFVKLKSPKRHRWLMVTGGPILRDGSLRSFAKWRREAAKHGEGAGTFGVIEEVAPALVELLDDFLEGGVTV